MICLTCGCEFEITQGSKAHNRKLCYTCIPEGIDKLERNRLYRVLIKRKVDTQKLLRGCDKCGYNRCAAALEWHHPNDDKLVDPSNCLSSNGYKGYLRYEQEIEKCELLCANCHREEHFIAA